MIRPAYMDLFVQVRRRNGSFQRTMITMMTAFTISLRNSEGR